MQNPVTERFIACHNKLKEDKKVASSRQFALAINTAPQSLNQVLKGKRMAGVGPMFKDEIEEDRHVKEDKIMYVPIAAHAGYCDQFHEEVTQEDLEFFSLPGYQPCYGEHRCFDVAGDSMEPTLFTGDKIICSLVSSNNGYNCIRDNYVYVVITHNDILVKRVTNRLRQEGVLYLNSDNGSPYKTVEVQANEP